MAFGGDFLKSIIEQQKKKQSNARPQIAPQQQLPESTRVAPVEPSVAPIAPIEPVSTDIQNIQADPVVPTTPAAPVTPETQELEQTQGLIKNAQEIQAGVNPAEGQALVKDVLSQSLGESVSSEEVQGAMPLMKELMGELGQQKADIKSELAKKIDLGQPEKLSKGEKIAVGLLMILPAIVGALTGRGGKGLAATGQGIIALEKLQQGEQKEFERKQKEDVDRRKALRSELLGITKAQINLATAAEKLEASKLKDEKIVATLGSDLASQIKEQNQGKNLTESQAKALAFGGRMQMSDEILTDLESKLNFSDPKFLIQAGEIPLPLTDASLSLPNVARNPEIQQLLQGQRTFVNALLRRDSGATISESEFANAKQEYFPQFGDSDEVIQQKQNARKVALQVIKLSSGLSDDIFNQVLDNAVSQTKSDKQQTQQKQPKQAQFTLEELEAELKRRQQK